MIRKETKNSLKRIDLLAATIMAHSRACTLATAPAPKAAAKVEYIEL
jgi:phage terminase large subunit-like protein